MIINCPECASEFDVPLGLLGFDGRKLRCANCRHEWFQEGPMAAAAKNQPESPYKALNTPISNTGHEISFDIYKNAHDAPSFEAMLDEKPAKGPKKPFKIPVIRIGGTTKAVAVALLFTVIATQIFIALTPVLAPLSPGLGRMYAGFGRTLPIKGEGIGIDRLRLQSVWAGGGSTIAVSTKLTNLTEKAVKVPPVTISMLDDSGNATGQSWNFAPPVKELGPEESIPFDVKLPEMPKTKSEVLTLKASF